MQTVATGTEEMGASIKEIAEHITGVAKAAEATTEGASQTEQASVELSKMASELHVLTRTFTS